MLGLLTVGKHRALLPNILLGNKQLKRLCRVMRQSVYITFFSLLCQPLFSGIQPLEMCPKECLLEYIRVFIVTLFLKGKILKNKVKCP